MTGTAKQWAAAKRAIGCGFLATFASLLAATPAAANDANADAARNAEAARVELFSPTGYVKHVRQVAARFSAAMVALGDPRLADPFNVSCAAPGHGRWADARNWVYDFDDDLPAGLQCRFRLLPAAKTLAGARIAGKKIFSFNTGGPAIIASLPREGWTALDEDQVFLLRLEAPATAASIESHAFCGVEGIADRIPVRVLRGSERQEVLDQRKAMGYDYLRLLWKRGAVSNLRVRDRTLEQQDEGVLVVKCASRLPPVTKVILDWAAGIETPSGIATLRDQRLAFRVRPAFTAQVECTRTNPRAGCTPVSPIMVNFSAPIPRAQAMRIALKSPDGTSFQPSLKEAAQAPTVEGVTFTGPFPELSTLSVLLPDKLEDDAGRTLENAARFPLSVRVDAYPPLVKFSATFGILEAREGGILPVTLRNVEASLPAATWSLTAKSLRLGADPQAIAAWLNRVEEAARGSGRWTRRSAAQIPAARAPRRKLEDPQDDSEDGGGEDAESRETWYESTGTRSVFADKEQTAAFELKNPLGGKPEEVVGIPLKNPGFYVVELQSPALGSALLGRKETRYVATAALVTDLAIHFKWGRESSLIWVTRLSDGRPVAGAEAAISDVCTGSTLWRGRTGPTGVAAIAARLGEPAGYGGCPWQHPLMVIAQKGADFSFTESTWNKGIMPYEFGLGVGNAAAADIYHSVLDRALFRAGETVSMKHFLRRHVSSGIAIPSGAAGPHEVTVTHQGSGQRFDFTALFDATGIATSEWKIPEEAKLGAYQVMIDRHPSADFKVEQFRLPSMRATITGPGHPLIAAHDLDLDLHVAYLAGGGAAGLPVTVRTLVQPQPLHFADYADYQFDGSKVIEGVSSDAGGAADVDFEAQGEKETTRTQTSPLILDAAGSARLTLRGIPALAGPSRLVAELEYSDANGETLTSTGTVRLLPAALSLGLRREGWVGSVNRLRFRVVALDLDGKPLPRQPIVVSLYRSSAYSYRKRLIGGFYSYETVRETKRLAPQCNGMTNAQGLLICEVAPGASGQIIVRAETQDAQGALAGATSSMWVVDENDWWFGGTSGDRMDVLPEKKEYEAGETARFQVRMPFRAATALVSVEREGVLSSFVTQLKGNAPIVEIPVSGAYAPNAFVSVLALRGRVAHLEANGTSASAREEITALVDLTKPSYRLGVAQINVGWRPHRLDVTVEADKAVYQVRELAQVKIHVAGADGQALPEKTEVAVAAVDEALLDLNGNTSWDLLRSMMGARGLEVWTSTAQMQVVGKRHYGRKAIPHGGGGGREVDRARELFDSLLLWRPRLLLDVHGDAIVSVPLNDSLSSFRIIAVAHGGAQLFGSGAATLRSTRDLILTSGLPPLVRESDAYAATFTVRNTTDHAISARVQASGAALESPGAPQDLQLAAGQSRDVAWQASAPLGAAAIDWDVSVRDLHGVARDRLKIGERVIPAYPVRTYEATIAQLSQPLSIPVQLPKGAIAARGGLSVTLQEKLGGNLPGVREFMSRYPYTCLEQQVSKAVVLRSREQWDALMQRLPAYLDQDGLLKYFATERLAGDDGLTAYVLAIANEAGWPLNEGDRAQMLGALTRFVQGKLVRSSALPTADLTIRKLQALDALSRYHAAKADMLDSLSIETTLLPTSALLDWIGILERTPDIANAAAKGRDAFAILRARLNFQGTAMGFSTERTDALWWLMISADSNANRMLLAALPRAEWREDVPRLVRGALGRQQFGRWNTTVANAWGVLAIEKYSAAFESVPVSGKTVIRYGPEQHEVPWPNAEGGAAVSMPWQAGRGMLELGQAGSGAPWAMVRASAALPLDAPFSSGFKIVRTVTAVEQRRPGIWTRGDVARVHLELQAQSDMSWVVVDDPIPAGAAILGQGLGGSSALLERDETRGGMAWPAFEERRFDGFRAYYRFVPKGHWSVEYTERLNNPGTFTLPATRVEAMYAPEMFGELPNAAVAVRPMEGAP